MGRIFVFINILDTGNIRSVTMNRKTASKKGLTLIEVLIALVILSVGVSSLMLAMSRCLAVVRTARNRNVAHNLLRMVEMQYPIDKIAIEEGLESGGFEDMEGYSWQREVIMVDEEERRGLFLVTTRVIWAERGRDSFEEVITYKYAPNAESVTRRL
jgi:prepilin-type N-terminal cleavage/methylation domain-containing protein